MLKKKTDNKLFFFFFVATKLVELPKIVEHLDLTTREPENVLKKKNPNRLKHIKNEITQTKYSPYCAIKKGGKESV